MSEQQELWNEIGQLTIDTNVLSLTVITMLSREAKAASDPDQWLREFADETLSAIDRARNDQATLQGTIEMARNRLDQIMSAVRLHIAE
jgi:hypothetical protein